MEQVIKRLLDEMKALLKAGHEWMPTKPKQKLTMRS
jgi:hypothetical protein